MAIELVVAKEAAKTGAYLRTALQLLHVDIGPSDKRVSYGVTLAVPTGSVALNANAGRLDKYDQLIRLRDNGIVVPPMWSGEQEPTRFPLLARKRHHKGGKDIMPVFMSKEMPWRIAAGSQFFTEYVPWNAEFRVWVYRSAHLGTDQKVMTTPTDYKRIGCNLKNGFTFQTVKELDIPRVAVDAAIRSVAALDLDFGAVDILQGEDGRFYVLEVNTAPGVENPERRLIKSLAQKIATWSINPTRRKVN